MMAFQQIKGEYESVSKDLGDLSYDELVAHPVLQEVHRKGAETALQVCRANRGIYIKAAQFVASLQGGAGDHGIPKHYVTVLQELMDHAPHHAFSEIEGVFLEQFGERVEDLFREFDQEPIAAASLAQVHLATLHTGERVAVKVEYPGLWQMMATDFGVFRTMANMMKPGGFDLSWLVEDLQVALTSELDFTKEALNADKCRAMFLHRRDVKVPTVHWNLTTRCVLTMEYVKGVRVNDSGSHCMLGLKTFEVADTLASVMAEMVLCHGFVHGDPHAGNVHVRARPGSHAPQIIILDHGLYHTIDEKLRTDFCSLVRSCILCQRGSIQSLSQNFAGSLHRFFPLILSPWFIMGSGVGRAELLAARDGRLPPDVKLKDIGDFLVAMHNNGGNMLGVLHSMGYTRGLLNDLALPERRRVKAFGEFATKGIMEPRARPGQSTSYSLFEAWTAYLKLTYVSVNVDLLALQIRLLLLLSTPSTQITIVGGLFATLLAMGVRAKKT